MRAGILAALTCALVAVAGVSQAQLPPGGTFVDDDGNPHEGSIEAIVAEPLTSGCAVQPPRYCPDRTVLRNQMAVFLVRALDEEGNLPAHQGYFDDVPAGQWFTGYVERLYELRLTSGCSESPRLFCPEQPVGRHQMAVFLVAMMNETGNIPPFQGYFDDVPEGQWFTGAVERLYELEVTAGCGVDPPRYCPDQPTRRDQMAVFLTRALGLTATPPPPRPPLALVHVAGGFSQPLGLAAPSGDPRLFVVEQAGRIRVLDGGARHLFLDIAAKVSSGGERGLLGLAFHPEYSVNGRFFVNYTDGAGDTVVEEYRVSANPNQADATPVRQLLWIDQPFSNHNGGQLAFGPDGLLYVGMGDGGGAGDPQGNAQSPSSRLGKLLRIDVDSGRSDVWASGLRNPWRFSFDDYAGHLYIGDVGQNAREEINVTVAARPGHNFGWDRYEGSLCYDGPCDPEGLTFPVHEYGPEGCSVVGGHVYRADHLPRLQGHYLYGDFCGGWVRSFFYDGDRAIDHRSRFQLSELITSFGRDGQGELYVVTREGNIYRIDYGS